jgi:CubicO group peptidase (beta-lactamase class C family)
VLTKYDTAAGTYDTRPATRAITIRQLLTHTSGIGYAWSDPGLALVQRKTGTADLDLPLVHEPGEKWTYGASTRVLGLVIEKISGQPVDVFLRARILGPLGMRDTGFTVPEAAHARVVTVHQKADGRITETQNPATMAAPVRGDGGLFSTASDYSRFVQMLLNRGQLGGTRILSARTVADVSRNHTGAVRVRPQPTADACARSRIPSGRARTCGGSDFRSPRRRSLPRRCAAPAA